MVFQVTFLVSKNVREEIEEHDQNLAEMVEAIVNDLTIAHGHIFFDGWNVAIMNRLDTDSEDITNYILTFYVHLYIAANLPTDEDSLVDLMSRSTPILENLVRSNNPNITVEISHLIDSNSQELVYSF